jgi:regulator of protease activity HflC (stomatin/prohibitin superfamily)
MKQLPPAAKDPTLRLLQFVYNLVEGDHQWAERRSILLFTAVIIFALMGRATEHITEWWTLAPYIENLPGPVVFALSFLHPQTWRHVFLPLAGMFLALGVAANYVRDLFDLPNLSTGDEYLKAAMFGQDYPTIILRSTGYEPDKHYLWRHGKDAKVDGHSIVKIGGPGYVTVAPGNVALYERVGGPSKVAGAGQHFLRRFESLREVIDLRDQIRERGEVKALTKDGLAVTVQNVQVSFRVRTSNRPRTQREVYPYSVSAVKRIAYGKTVGVKGASVWTEGVPNAVASTIRNYISRSLLDDLITRSESETKDPRDKIKAMFEHKDTRKKFNDMGVDLLWVSLGHIKVDADALSERIDAWGAEWKRAAQNTLSEAEAEKLKLMEYAKTMARLELIEKGLKGLPMNVNDSPTYDRIVLQIVEALSTTGRRVGASHGYGYGYPYSERSSGSSSGGYSLSQLSSILDMMVDDKLEGKSASQKVISGSDIFKKEDERQPPSP